MTTEIQEGYKRCSTCGEVKPVEEYYKDRYGKDGLRGYCKTCASERRKKYYYKNKDRMREHMKEYRKENKDRKREYDKKYFKCVKIPSCPLVGGNGAKFVILTCPICGKEFRLSKARVDYQYERAGQTHFYCSRECYHESIRKSHKSEYEKNINRIRKEQRV